MISWHEKRIEGLNGAGKSTYVYIKFRKSVLSK